MNIQKTPLNAIHREFGARMVEFAGWDMPVQYESALQEHEAVRERVGVFDVSHMGEIEFIGKDALALAQKVTTNDVSQIEDGQAQYSAFLYPEGTFIDDIVVYRISGEHVFICVNAANKDKDFQWVREHQEGDVQVLDKSASYAQLAIQGPQAEGVLQQLTDTHLNQISRYRFTWGKVSGARALISRTGYTGEDGFEIYIPPQQAETVWRRLFEVGRSQGITAAGLAARNTLRLEVKYPLYGNDIDDSTTPYEAGLGWIVKLTKGEFVGRQALEKQKREGIRRKLVGFEMLDRGIARDHYPVLLDGERIGEVRSGIFSPTLKKSVGLVYLPIEKAEVGQVFHVEVRGKPLQAQVVKTPFLKAS